MITKYDVMLYVLHIYQFKIRSSTYIVAEKMSTRQFINFWELWWLFSSMHMYSLSCFNLIFSYHISQRSDAISTIYHLWWVSGCVSIVHGTGATVDHLGPTFAHDWFSSQTPDDPVSEELDDPVWRAGFHAGTWWRSLHLRHETHIPKPAPWTPACQTSSAEE